MNIQGCRYWNDRARYYGQENNPTEHLLKCRLDGKGWLETCGPTAAINCLAAMGVLSDWTTPGGYHPQPEQELTDYLNDPKNFSKLKAVWGSIDPEAVLGNEVAEWYPLAVREVFGLTAKFVGPLSLDSAIGHLSEGRAIQVCLVQPGHFVALVAYDFDKQEFIINDPWSGRWPDGKGWNKRMPVSEFERNLTPKSLVYQGGENHG
jgi:hypothetical protein